MLRKSIFFLSLAIGTRATDEDVTLFTAETHDEPADVSPVEEGFNQSGIAFMEPEEETYTISTTTVVEAEESLADPIELPQGGLVLREPTQDDVDLLVHLEVVSFPLDIPAWYIPYIEAKPELIRVAQIGDALVGMVLVMMIENRPKALYIANLAVLPEYRCAGIGSALLDWAVGFARENGFTTLVLHVHTENSNALRLYLKHGFAVAVTIPDFYTQLDPQSAFTMVKYL